MGTMIHLAVGNLEIDWGKNSGFADHSALFQPEDLCEIPYQYAVDGPGEDGSWQIETEWKEGLSSPLRKVVERLRMLGFTDRTSKQDLECVCTVELLEAADLSFEEIQRAVSSMDLRKLVEDYGKERCDLREFVEKQIAPLLGFVETDERRAEFRFEFVESVSQLNAYSVLVLFSQNPGAQDLPVTWDFKDHEESGWAQRSDYLRPPGPGSRFLVVTEGSSDSLILKHAFHLLMPQVEDFFHYVDMHEGYPFSGTGNVLNFVKGLVSISVQNKIVVLFDNDAEGVFGHSRCSALNLPPNMRVVKLPDLEGFNAIRTMGPNGEMVSDINGKAASIECYLDLGDRALIQWTSYNQKTSTYQGELLAKDRYKKEFLDQNEVEAGYDYSRLIAVLRCIVDSCVEIQESAQSRSYQSLLDRWA